MDTKLEVLTMPRSRREAHRQWPDEPTKPADLDEVHALQDKLTVEQASRGEPEFPKWDQTSQNKIRQALTELGTTLTDTSRSFGTKEEVDPIQHLISAVKTTCTSILRPQKRRQDRPQASCRRRSGRRFLVKQPL